MRSTAARTMSCWPRSRRAPSHTWRSASRRDSGNRSCASAASSQRKAYGSETAVANGSSRAGAGIICAAHRPAMLTGSLDSLRAQALSADASRPVDPVIVDPNRLQVGEPPPLGLVHRVAHVVPGHRTFSANVAASCHNRAILPWGQGERLAVDPLAQGSPDDGL